MGKNVQAYTFPTAGAGTPQQGRRNRINAIKDLLGQGLNPRQYGYVDAEITVARQELSAGTPAAAEPTRPVKPVTPVATPEPMAPAAAPAAQPTARAAPPIGAPPARQPDQAAIIRGYLDSGIDPARYGYTPQQIAQARMQRTVRAGGTLPAQPVPPTGEVDRRAEIGAKYGIGAPPQRPIRDGGMTEEQYRQAMDTYRAATAEWWKAYSQATQAAKFTSEAELKAYVSEVRRRTGEEQVILSKEESRAMGLWSPDDPYSKQRVMPMETYLAQKEQWLQGVQAGQRGGAVWSGESFDINPRRVLGTTTAPGRPAVETIDRVMAPGRVDDVPVGPSDLILSRVTRGAYGLERGRIDQRVNQRKNAIRQRLDRLKAERQRIRESQQRALEAPEAEGDQARYRSLQESRDQLRRIGEQREELYRTLRSTWAGDESLRQEYEQLAGKYIRISRRERAYHTERQTRIERGRMERRQEAERVQTKRERTKAAKAARRKIRRWGLRRRGRGGLWTAGAERPTEEDYETALYGGEGVRRDTYQANWDRHRAMTEMRIQGGESDYRRAVVTLDPATFFSPKELESQPVERMMQAVRHIQGRVMEGRDDPEHAWRLINRLLGEQVSTERTGEAKAQERLEELKVEDIFSAALTPRKTREGAKEHARLWLNQLRQRVEDGELTAVEALRLARQRTEAIFTQLGRGGEQEAGVPEGAPAPPTDQAPDYESASEGLEKWHDVDGWTISRERTGRITWERVNPTSGQHEEWVLEADGEKRYRTGEGYGYGQEYSQGWPEGATEAEPTTEAAEAPAEEPTPYRPRLRGVPPFSEYMGQPTAEPTGELPARAAPAGAPPPTLAPTVDIEAMVSLFETNPDAFTRQYQAMNEQQRRMVVQQLMQRHPELFR